MKRIKDFFQQLPIKLSYSSFCYAVQKLGSPQLALAHYQDPKNAQRVYNKQNYKQLDKYQKISRSKGLNANYIHYWAEQLETSKDVIAEEVLRDDFDQPFRDKYVYKSHEDKVKTSLNKQNIFLKMRLKSYDFLRDI